ncbi:MAG TPA: hypothetical protein VGG39_11900 [Polyangiaceae bacterium]
MDFFRGDECARPPSTLPLPAAAASTTAAPTTRAWRCRACASVLGLLRGGELHLRRGDVELWVTGSCRRRCRRCGATNAIEIAAGGGAR